VRCVCVRPRSRATRPVAPATPGTTAMLASPRGEQQTTDNNRPATHLKLGAWSTTAPPPHCPLAIGHALLTAYGRQRSSGVPSKEGLLSHNRRIATSSPTLDPGDGRATLAARPEPETGWPCRIRDRPFCFRSCLRFYVPSLQASHESPSQCPTFVHSPLLPSPPLSPPLSPACPSPGLPPCVLLAF